jgi:hypothetical protein
MIQKKAPFSGMFTPQVSNGDCVLSRQLIGTILFGDEFRQLANGSGEINKIIGQQEIVAGAVLCEIDDASAKCLAVNNALLSEKLARRISRKPRKKAAKKTVRKRVKVAKKPTLSSSKKATKKASKKTSKKTTKKAVKKIIGPSSRKASKKSTR